MTAFTCVLGVAAKRFARIQLWHGNVYPLTTRRERQVKQVEALRPEAAALRMLDGFELTWGAQRLQLLPCCERLVAYVALKPPAVHRSLIVGDLWPESSESCATASLRSAVHRLVRCCDATVIVSTRTHLQLAPSVHVDVMTQHSAVLAIEAQPEADAPPLQVIDALIGELLPGWYEDWVGVERERLRNRRLHALEIVSRRFSRANRHTAAIDAALAALAVDPLRETAHRAVVEAHLAEGNRAEARRRWLSYRSLVLRRLRLEPRFSWEEILAVHPSWHAAEHEALA